MDSRARLIIERWKLQPHPEGGFYREVFRSVKTVERIEDGAERSAMTTILYLLVDAECSAWHRVTSDEAWHFYEGAPLELSVTPPDARSLDRHRLGSAFDASSPGLAPVHVVPGGHWQSARTLGTHSLVGCTVGPGFDFKDFVMGRDLGGSEAVVAARLAALNDASR